MVNNLQLIETSCKCIHCGDAFPFTSEYFKSYKIKGRESLRRSCLTCHKKQAKDLGLKYRKKHKVNCRQYTKTPKGRFNSYKGGAKARGLDFEITFEEFKTFWNQPCVYCSGEIKTIGLDRIDPKIGYVIANLISCCSWCNSMKLDKGIEEFRKKIKKIYRNLYGS